MTGRRLLEGMSTPLAPERLRARALRAARIELDRAGTPAFVDRLWASRPLRWSWAAACAALLAAHVMIGSRAPAVLPPTTSRTVHVAAGDPLLQSLLPGRRSADDHHAVAERRQLAELLRLDLS